MFDSELDWNCGVLQAEVASLEEEYSQKYKDDDDLSSNEVKDIDKNEPDRTSEVLEGEETSLNDSDKEPGTSDSAENNDNIKEDLAELEGMKVGGEIKDNSTYEGGDN